MVIFQGTMLHAAEPTWNGGKWLEGEYQRAINIMGRATLGAFESAPVGIVTKEGGLTPARALPNHRQVRFTERLYARPDDGGRPEENLSRERSALTERLGAAAATAQERQLRSRGGVNNATFPPGSFSRKELEP